MGNTLILGLVRQSADAALSRLAVPARKRGRPPNAGLHYLAFKVGEVLCGQHIPITKGRDGRFATLLRVVAAEVYAARVPEDMFDCIKAAADGLR